MKLDVILDPGLSPYEVRELGLLAESYGLHAVWTSNYPSSRDPFINLCPLALGELCRWLSNNSPAGPRSPAWERKSST